MGLPCSIQASPLLTGYPSVAIAVNLYYFCIVELSARAASVYVPTHTNTYYTLAVVAMCPGVYGYLRNWRNIILSVGHLQEY